MFFLVDPLVSVNRWCGKKAVSAEAAQLYLFTEQELGFTEVVPYITLAAREKGAVSFICVHFSVEISWQREVRRQDEIWSVCKHIDLCASTYVHKRWAVIYVEMTRKGQVPGIHFFLQDCIWRKSYFFWCYSAIKNEISDTELCFVLNHNLIQNPYSRQSQLCICKL